METRVCKALTRSGAPCKSWKSNGSDFCILHGPRKTEIQREGGKHKSLQYRLQQQQSPELQRVLSKLVAALDEVHDKELSPSQGQALASLGSSVLKVREQGILEVRLEALEKRMKSERGKHGTE
jgi:hypothetical protein